MYGKMFMLPGFYKLPNHCPVMVLATYCDRYNKEGYSDHTFILGTTTGYNFRAWLNPELVVR